MCQRGLKALILFPFLPIYSVNVPTTFFILRHQQLNQSYTIENLLSQTLVPSSTRLSTLDSLIPAHLRFDHYPNITNVITGNNLPPWHCGGTLDLSQNGGLNLFPPIFPFVQDGQLGKKHRVLEFKFVGQFMNNLI